MVGGDDDRVRPRKRLVEGREREPLVGHVWIGETHVDARLARSGGSRHLRPRLEHLRESQARTLARVGDVALVGDAENRYRGVGERIEVALQQIGDVLGHPVVDRTGALDEIKFLRTLPQKQRVDGDAVAAHTGSRLVEIYSWMVVRQRDGLARIEVVVGGDHRQFVGQRDVHVAVGVLDEFDELRERRVRRLPECALDEGIVECRRTLDRPLVDAADRAVVRAQFRDDAAR